MINTSAFESFQRYKKLCDAVRYFDNWNTGTHSPYEWIQEFLIAAIHREVEFMRANKEQWEKDLNGNV